MKPQTVPQTIGRDMKEIWKPINGYQGRYEISNHGRVRSFVNIHNGKNNEMTGDYILKQYFRRGYKAVTLTNENGVLAYCAVHRLVAEHFLGDCTGMQINHIDGNKENNNVTNLEICTMSQNILHAYKNGLMKPCDNCFKKKVNVIKDGVIVNTFKSIREMCREMKLDRRAVQRTIDGIYKHYRGYNFQCV